MDALLHPTAAEAFGTYPARDARRLLSQTLAALDAPGDPAALSLLEARQTVYQWLAVLETAHIAELAGLTDDLRVLAEVLDPDPLTPGTEPTPLRAALHRAGLSVERVAPLGRSAGLTPDLLALGQRLVALSERIGEDT